MAEDSLSLRLLRFLPRNLLSRAFGRLAACRRPRFLVRRGIRAFARHFEIDLAAAARPIEDYASLLEFFTRTLKPGLRPVDADPTALVSPVDGRVGAFGRIESGRMIQAKGLDYGVEAFLGSRATADRFRSGSFLTLYLSPRDYHRIHAPEGGRIVTSLYCAGTLWPVNPPAVRSLPGLFAVNERVTTLIETKTGAVAVGMVGATNVGSIRLSYHDLVTNRGRCSTLIEHLRPLEIRRGAELGIFELGSTVVLLIEDPAYRFTGIEEGQWLPQGRMIARRCP